MEVESRFIAAFTHSPLWFCKISRKDLTDAFLAYPSLSNVKSRREERGGA